MATIRYIDENGQWQDIVIEGGGSGSDVDIYPTEYSDEFNDDFTS